MLQERLSGFAILRYRAEILDKIDVDSIIKEFAATKLRKKNSFFG